MLFGAALGRAGMGGGADRVVHRGASWREGTEWLGDPVRVTGIGSGSGGRATGCAIAARRILFKRVRPPKIKQANRIKPPLRCRVLYSVKGVLISA